MLLKKITSTTIQHDESPQDHFKGKFNDLTRIYRSMFTQALNIDKSMLIIKIMFLLNFPLIFILGRKLLDDFSATLYDLTKYSRFDLIDELNYTENTAGSSIVSSMDFDRDQEFFGVGGVSRQIKIFDFNKMTYSSFANTTHCPVRSINCLSKISCLAWSPYIKSQIASSDYRGVIDIWDVSTGQKTLQFEEHIRRAWSVDICAKNPNLLASASDDTTVKVWSLSQNTSIHTLKLKGNVCCAKFAPNNSHYLAVGSAGIVCS